MREEMLYFWPQLETKIMNEGCPFYRYGVLS
jgi:spore cortex formation protein SpoVR/YcgB (stage V sporulation)